MFNPARAADEIKKEFIGYISTTFHFRDNDIQNKLLSELDKTVSNGPFIEIKDTFLEGKSIRSLIDEGILSPLFEELEKNKPHKPRLPVSRPLYAHQEKAIRKIVAGKNIVVSTGTGSGKTNCFIIPVINELLREKQAGTLDDGVRAIFIYPMNALANDQIKGLREILMAYPEITFGVYNGGTEHKEEDAIKLYEAMYLNKASIRYLENKLVSIAKMNGNYKVLTKNTYQNTVIKESTKSTLEKFIDNLKLVLTALGYKVLTPAPVAKNDTTYLYCKRAGANGKGFVSNGGFTVLKNSVVSSKTVPSMETYGKSYYALRCQLLETGVIKDNIFTRDYEFNAPSAASSVLLGRTSNGNIEWLTETGTKLKDLDI